MNDISCIYLFETGGSTIQTRSESIGNEGDTDLWGLLAKSAIRITIGTGVDTFNMSRKGFWLGQGFSKRVGNTILL
jgi:hypothetical protein